MKNKVVNLFQNLILLLLSSVLVLCLVAAVVQAKNPTKPLVIDNSERSNKCDHSKAINLGVRTNGKVGIDIGNGMIIETTGEVSPGVGF